MNDKQQKPFGTWKSPISASMMAGQKRLNDVRWAGDGDTIVWVEGRDGKGVLVAQKRGEASQDISGDHSVRGGVGYGGGELDVRGDVAIFSANDGCLYRTKLHVGTPRQITPAFGSVASPAVSPNGKWVAYVHTDGGTDLLAVVDAEGRQWPQKVVVGADFYMQPAWSADGKRLAWISWDQPNMPWDGTRLETATVTETGRSVELGPIEVWGGGPNVAVQQPTFSPDGRWLAFTSDESGYHQLYVRNLETGETVALSHGESDHAGPAWIQGLRHFAWTPESKHIYAIKSSRGVMSLIRYGVEGGMAEVASASSYNALSQVSISPNGHVAFLGSSSSIPPRVVALWRGDDEAVIQRSSNERISTRRLSKMQPVSWILASGGQEEEIFANYYPPTNPDFEAKGRPPAIVMVHGGPTSQRTAGFESRNQFFASRGYAVLDVNYRGSTGYGRDYMEALRGNWGVSDVEDVVSAAKFLVDADLAHPDKLVVMGGSAGGYTVLQVLTNHPGAFAAGVCLYGIANLFTLQMGTHKFEAAYNDRLIGPLPDAADAYRERSPIFRADQIADPVAVYHGARDKVVPIDQAEAIVKSLRSRGIAHEYHVYDDEGHGWRKSDNVEHFYDSLLEFLTEHVVFS